MSDVRSQVPRGLAKSFSGGSFKKVGTVLWHVLPNKEHRLRRRSPNAGLYDNK